MRRVAQPESAAYLVGAWVGCDSSSGATCDVTLTFSVVLSEGSNAVHLVYYDLSSPQSNRGLGSDATIGEQWSSGVSQYGAFQPVLSTGLDITLPNP
ncbi:MAG: hypothetical protein IPJ65_29570 [Archangiaceae bacterium]|nr:hypothetical protein [Archangiaceae bacterium]